MPVEKIPVGSVAKQIKQVQGIRVSRSLMQPLLLALQRKLSPVSLGAMHSSKLQGRTGLVSSFLLVLFLHCQHCTKQKFE